VTVSSEGTETRTRGEPGAPSRRPRAGPRALLSAAVLLALSAVTGTGTWAAFSATTASSGNSFTTGTVVLTDDDSGSTLLTLSDARPGDYDESCITMSYTGSLASTVRLHGTTSGTGLDQHVDLTVTRGSGAAGFDDCTGFTPDAVGVVYTGRLQEFPDDHATGLVDPDTWTNGTDRQYRIRVELPVSANDAAQGLNATQTLTWEARNQ